MSDQDNDIIEATPFRRAEITKASRWSIIRPAHLAVGFIFACLAVAALFLFSAKAVQVSFNPAAETFRFTSGLTYELGGRFLMLPGQYSYRAARNGYQVMEGEIEVTSEADQTFSFDLIKLPGILNLSTSPEAGARILIDQVEIGSSPMVIDDISAGLHDVSIRSERYLDVDTEIEIEGMRIEQSLNLVLEPAWADLNINSRPGGATVLVEDNPAGTTPGTVEVLQGQRIIGLSLPGYKLWQTTVNVTAGDTLDLPTVILEKSDGKVTLISSPARANVNINGRYMGQTPLELVLPPGKTYQIELSKVGYAPAQRTFTLKPEQDLSLNTTLSPVLGVVRLQVVPDNGELFVDDKPRGQPNQRLSLTASPHSFRIVTPGFADYEATVTPHPGTIQQLVVKLQTEKEARAAATPDTITNPAGQSMKLIIPDEMQMGAGRREPGRRSNEVLKEVQLTRAYYLSTTEVTNVQFKLFDPGHDSGMLGRALLNDNDRPVVNVSWNQAAAFCNWLSSKEGLPPAYEEVDGIFRAATPITTGYRLPTEAEWAWAARYAGGPNPKRFPWGDTMPPDQVHANYADVAAANMVPYHIDGYTDNYRGPAPAASFPANAFGIHDLAGNVAEWIHDYYSVEIIREKQIDPAGPATGDYHVIRGSSYQHGRFSELRWTYRDYGSDGRPDVGIRVSRYLE